MSSQRHRRYHKSKLFSTLFELNKNEEVQLHSLEWARSKPRRSQVLNCGAMNLNVCTNVWLAVIHTNK